MTLLLIHIFTIMFERLDHTCFCRVNNTCSFFRHNTVSLCAPFLVTMERFPFTKSAKQKLEWRYLVQNRPPCTPVLTQHATHISLTIQLCRWPTTNGQRAGLRGHSFVFVCNFGGRRRTSAAEACALFGTYTHEIHRGKTHKSSLFSCEVLSNSLHFT